MTPTAHLGNGDSFIHSLPTATQNKSPEAVLPSPRDFQERISKWIWAAVCHKGDQHPSLAFKGVPLWEWTLGFISPFEIEYIKVRHLKAKTQWSPSQSQVQTHRDELCYYEIVFAAWDGGRGDKERLSCKHKADLEIPISLRPQGTCFFGRTHFLDVGSNSTCHTWGFPLLPVWNEQSY